MTDTTTLAADVESARAAFRAAFKLWHELSAQADSTQRQRFDAHALYVSEQRRWAELSTQLSTQRYSEHRAALDWANEQRDRAIDATADAALDAHLEAQYDEQNGDSE